MKRAAFLLLFLFILPAASAQEKRFSVPTADSPSLGPAGAPVTIVEFIDFQ